MKVGHNHGFSIYQGKGSPLFIKGKNIVKGVPKRHIGIPPGHKLKRTKMREQRKRERYQLRETAAREAREIQALGRRHAEEVMRRLCDIAQNSMNETAAIAAAQAVLDRTYGKANQTHINANIDANGKTTDISAKELDERINTALKRVEELTARKAKPAEGKEQLVDLRKLHRDPNSTPLN